MIFQDMKEVQTLCESLAPITRFEIVYDRDSELDIFAHIKHKFRGFKLDLSLSREPDGTLKSRYIVVARGNSSCDIINRDESIDRKMITDFINSPHWNLDGSYTE